LPNLSVTVLAVFEPVSFTEEDPIGLPLGVSSRPEIDTMLGPTTAHGVNSEVFPASVAVAVMNRPSGTAGNEAPNNAMPPTSGSTNTDPR
jgi:hypothetical protein